jgi:CRISPR/Cas system CMR subunit Cmr4 (Cas7 group RAMP superfamily)
MRSYLDDEMADKLFGDMSIENSSTVTVSDAVFKEYKNTIRPRLKMNSATGTGEDKLKFDLACIDAGAVMEFELLLKTNGQNKAYEDAIVDILSAMDSGVITLGGQRSNGFGEVKLTVKSHSFDMNTEQGRMDWISNAECTDDVTLHDVNKACTVFTLTVKCDSFIVKDGGFTAKENQKARKDEKKNKDKYVTTAMKSGGKYVLPASSLKGVLRNRVQMIAEYKGVPNTANNLFGRTPESGKKGDQGDAGKVRVREFSVKTEEAHDVSRTRIDRFTGGVMDKSLFTEETLADTVTITVEAATEDKTCLAVLFYAMRDLALGLYGFGGEGSVGRGYLSDGAKLNVKAGNSECTFTFTEGKTSADNTTDFVVGWLRELDDHKGGSK